MRRGLVAALATLAVLVPAGQAATQPGLTLVKRAPLTVRGVHFRAGERVRVVATGAGTTITRVVRAASTGAFLVAFAMPSDDRCSGFFVRAIRVGNATVLLKIPPLECAPASSP